eukprot:CAMPEP_0182902226 /NCGR_PEP_ID=MMETSP0034_2-20130328/30301_1 /TAXON_ID=156128 /ORGANISM="Nephroselmis pyriformis, Strain CCMP717" /LENGTH=348 /DNA_ID=CAMNT_0025036835 /DNA_START=26 /DNA_END=1069 /DNA_ORIENTATION=+
MSTPLRVPASPGITRLDRVLDLVTEHESHIRSQDLKVDELARRLADNEDFLARELAPLRDVDVRAELEAAKGAVDRLHRQVVMLSQDQGLRADALDKVAGVASEFEEFKRVQGEAMAEMRRTYKSFLQEVLDKIGKQFEAHRTAVKSDVERAVEEARAAAAGAAEGKGAQAAASRELLALSETVAVHTRLFEEKEHELARAAKAQEEQLQAVLGRLDVISSERDKLRRRISKLSSEPPAAPPELAREVLDTLERHKRDISDLRTHHQQMRARHEQAEGDKASLAAALADARLQVSQLEQGLDDRSRDLSAFAESVSDVLHRRVSRAKSPEPVGVGFGYGGGLAGGSSA